jgi:Xaa-Pro aminopeptidase
MMYKTRRQEILDELPNYSAAIFCSGISPYKVGDEKWPFEVDRNFYYLTGLDRENMTLMLLKYDGRSEEVLFIERFDEVMAKWVGGKMLPKEAKAISDIKDVKYIDEIETKISNYMLMGSNADVTLYGIYNKQEKNQALSGSEKLIAEWKKCYPLVEVKQLKKALTEMRICKDENEVELLKKAIAITNDGIKAMLSNVKEGMNEAEVEAHFNFVVNKNGCKNSFSSIVASGVNATILHYVQNNQKIEKNSLVLTDLGASYKYYNADITRTFPASGKFTARQKEVYEVVLGGNKLIIDYAKPGMTLRELNDYLVKYYEEQLEKLGLLKNGKTVRDYYYHGVSHMLGMETHDVAYPTYVLKPGNVFTVEPGLYIEEENIGIRIEDNVLMTKEGCINLSKDIIKEVKDIEKFMSQ